MGRLRFVPSGFGGCCALACLAGLLIAATGCTRTDYRRRADREVYDILAEKTGDPRWAVPLDDVEAAPLSRMTDPNDPDHGTLPPDDPAAHEFMHHPYKLTGSGRWHRRGDAATVEDTAWQEGLPRDEQRNVLLSSGTVMRLALLHSREYQTEVEQLYLTALRLTLERFEFDVQWNGGNSTLFDHFGSGGAGSETNTLSTAGNLGLSRSLATGGQLVADFANSFVWEFTGKDASFASSRAIVTLTQPLLRGAFRHVRLEGLTQAERDVLYEVRDFTHFRRAFYVEVVSAFLALFRQLQEIRNVEANLASLERNLTEHQELAALGTMAQIRVDQVFQQVQQARLRLVIAQTSLETALDNFKNQLGLPPSLEARVDTALLKMFELNDPAIDELTRKSEALYLSLLQSDETPPAAVIQDGFGQLVGLQEQLQTALVGVEQDARRWKQSMVKHLPPAREQTGNLQPEEGTAADQDRARQLRLFEALSRALAEVRSSFEEDRRSAQISLKTLGETPPDDAWKKLLDLVGNNLRARVAEVFVIQAQIRVFLVELTPVDLEVEQTMDLALANRLDLMNQRGQVVDAWRRVEVAADGLESDLNVRVQADGGTDPDRNNPVAFAASNTRYRLGLEFDSPLNRRSERNVYRSSQIAYQRARRQYMATKDRVLREIRIDLRNLQRERLQFEITREQLLTAVRQVEQAQINVRDSAEADSSVTQDLLNALGTLLDAKNSLIGNWVSYETLRMNLYRDLDVMHVDAEGEWTNEHDPPEQR